MRVTYIGHATLLIEMGGKRLLTDPNFDPKLGKILDDNREAFKIMQRATTLPSCDSFRDEATHPLLPSGKPGYVLLPSVGGKTRRVPHALCHRALLPARTLAVLVAAKDSES